MHTLSTCPAPEIWQLLLAETCNEHQKAALLEHLDCCVDCTECLGRQVAEWNFGVRTGQATAPGDSQTTRQIVAQLAEVRPEITHRLQAEENLARESPPEIPGLSNFELVNQGGMGVVYRAWETELNRPVAVKLLSTVALASPAARARARREALTLARLRHANIVQIYRSGEWNGTPYLVLEWMPGGSLQKLLEQQGPLPEHQAATMARDLALALCETHALAIVHRDLKPDNVLLVPASKPGQPPLAKLADFGLARPEGETSSKLTETGMIVGTPSYMAAEQTGLDTTLGGVGPATDVHGLGAILYAMLTGQAPYEGKTSLESLQRSAQGLVPALSLFCPRLSADLRTIIEKCLRPVSSQRYRSAGELADDLNRYLEGRPILARPISPLERIAKWVRRQPAAAALVALLIVLAAGAFVRDAYLLHKVSAALREKDEAFTKVHDALVREQAAVEMAKTALEKRQQILTTVHDEVVNRLMRRGKALDPSDLAFLLNVRAHYQDWPLDPDPLAAHKFRAQGLLTLRQVFLNLHQYEEAYQTALLARSEYDRAVKLAPADPELAKQRLQASIWVHDSLIKTDRHAERESISRQLVEEAEQLVKVDSSGRKFLAYALINYATDLLELKQLEASKESAARALELYKQCVQDNPTDETLRRDEIRANYQAVLCYNPEGHLPGSQVAQYLILLKLTEDAVNALPTNRLTFQYFQRVALVGLAGGYRELGQFDQAMTAVNRTLELCRSVLNVPDDEQQDVASFLDGLIDCAIVKFEICYTQGRFQEARADLEDAVKMARLNRDKEPAVFERSWTLLRVMLRWVDFLTIAQQPDDARRQLVEVLELTKQWDTEKDHARHVHDLQSVTLTRLINLAENQEDHASAELWIAEKLKIAKPEERPELLILQKKHSVALSERPAATHVQP